MKEPLEYALIALIMVFLLYSSNHILNMISNLTYNVELEALALLDKVCSSSGYPADWDRLIISAGSSILDLGFRSDDHNFLDIGKVNFILRKNLYVNGDFKSNPYYLDPENAQIYWVDLKKRGFILEFKPLLNVTVTFSSSSSISIQVQSADGVNVTSKCKYLVSLIYFDPVNSILHISMSNQNRIDFPTHYILAVAAIAKLGSLSSISYWMNSSINYGIVYDEYLVSPIQFNSNLLLRCELVDDSLLLERLNYNAYSSGDVNVYQLTFQSNTEISCENLDSIYYIYYDNSTGEVCFLPVYPTAIWSSSGILNVNSMRYGNPSPPSTFSAAERIVKIGSFTYIVKLYLWRSEM